MAVRVRLLCLLLALSIPGATAAHMETQDLIRSGASLEAHDHGPFTPCPAAAQPHCVACVSALLLPSTTSSVRQAQTLPELLASARTPRIEPGRHHAPSLGRSPPVS